MSSKLGTLTLDLVARIGQFIEPVNQARDAATEATSEIEEGFNSAGLAAKAFGAILAGLSVGAVVDYVNSLMDAGDQLTSFAKLANSSVTQFQYYAKGARSAGIEMEQFADQMKDMQDRIGDFQQSGGGPLADFFANIAPLVGVTIQQFQKLSGPEALQLFYDSLEKVGATQNDIKFYMESIIGDSSKLIPLLEKGGAGFKKWGDNAVAAGSIVSESTANALADANESVQLILETWLGFKVQMAEYVAPAITLVIDNLDNIKAVAAAVGAVIATKLAVSMSVLALQFGRVAVSAVAAGLSFLNLAGTAATASVAVNVLRGATAFLGGPAGLAMLAFQGIAAGAAFLYMKKSSDEVKPSLDKQGKSVSELVNEYVNLSEAQQRAFKYTETKELVKLTDQYTKANQQVRAYASGIAETVLKDEASKNAVRGLIKQFDEKQISAEELANKINSLNIVSSDYQSNMDKHAIASTNAKTAMQGQQKIVESLESKNIQLAKANDRVTESVNSQAKAFLMLNQKQREALNSIDDSLLREKYIREFVQAGGTREKAESFADYRNSAGLGFGKQPLSSLEINKVNQGFAQKNYTFTKTDLAAIAKVNGIAAKNNFAQIEGLYGLPKGTLAALVLGESGGRAGAISPTGAKGLFQTTGVFRKEYKLNSKSSIEDQAIAAAKDLSKNVQAFGGLEKALMAYNAGAGGTRQYLAGNIGNGKNQMSPEKAKEVAGYVPKFAKYFAGVNGKTTVDQSILLPSQAELLEQTSNVVDAQKALDDKRKEIDAKYYSESQQLAQDHQDRLEKINQAYGGTPQLAEMIAKENSLYKSQSDILQAHKKAEYQSYFEFETDRITQITQNYKKEMSLIQASTDLSAKQKKEILAAKERQKQAEIALVKLDQDAQVLYANEAYMNETEVMLRRYRIEREQIILNKELSAQVKKQLLEANAMDVYFEMDRNQSKIRDAQQDALMANFQRNNAGNYGQFDGSYQQWDMQNAYSFASGGIDQAYNDQVSGINLIKDEEQRKQQLLEAEQRFLEAKKALNDQYNEQEREARNSMQADNIATYGAMFGGMADLVKGFAGESSGAYRTMIAAQKAANLASAIMSGYTSIAAAWGSKPFPYNLPAVAIATAKAGVFQAAIQAVSPGFSEGGYTGDGGKYEAAGIVHKGEGVLTQEEVSALGGPVGFESLRKAIRTGDLFENSEISASQSFMALAGYAEGGFVGGDVSLGSLSLPKQINKPMNNSMAQYSGGDINITVQVSDSGVTTSGGNTQDQKQLALLIGNTVKAVLRKEKGQGGLLSK